MNDSILLALTFDGKGKGTPLEGDAIAKTIKSKQLAWVHLDANHPDTKHWIEQETSYLDPYIADALLDDETRPRMTEIGNGILLILRGVNLNENADPEDMVSIRLWIDPHRIISVRRRKLKAVWDIEEKLRHGTGPKDAADFIAVLCDRLFERMEPTLAGLDDATDNLEEQLLESANSKLREEIVHIRKQAIIFRRYMAPQREAISQLRMTTLPWFNEKHKRHLQESLNHVTRYIEDLDAVRERAQIIKDELANMLADRLNKNMYVLSVIAAIFLPLGFLTGLLGINVGGIPGTEDANAFWIVNGLLVAIVLLQIFLFKKMKWF